MNEPIVILVTAPNRRVARLLANKALEKRLIACANLISGLESHYWWKNKIESSKEVLLILKTTKAKLRRVEKLLLDLHPYDTPEFVALRPNKVAKKYLSWLRKSVE